MAQFLYTDCAPTFLIILFTYNDFPCVFAVSVLIQNPSNGYLNTDTMNTRVVCTRTWNGPM